ncbi:MAG: LysE/ArgO family amino acid transporter [Clostridia bacterium]
MNLILHGFLMGFAYVAPIGMQNMYIINSAINYNRKDLLITIVLTIINDVSLAIFCFLGIGSIITQIPNASSAMSYIGFIAILFISYSIWNSQVDSSSKDTIANKSKLLITPFVIAWLNPQAILDGSIILGSMYSTISNNADRTMFIIGFSSSSIIWFSSLAIFIHLSKNKITANSQRLLNKVSAIILLYFGIKLLLS